MYKKLSVGLALSLSIIIGVPIFIGAQEDNQVSTETTESTDITTETTEVKTAETRLKERIDRLTAAKEKMTEKLASTEEKNIISKCESSQKIIEKLQTNLATAVEIRQSKYTEITNKLNDLSIKLSVAGVDIVELNAAIAVVESQSKLVVAAVETYNTYLSDLSLLESCETDPAGFKALLGAARQQRNEVVTLSNNVKKYINEFVKPVLRSMRTTLDSTLNTGEGEGQ